MPNDHDTRCRDNNSMPNDEDAYSTETVERIATEITPDLDADSSWDEIIEMVIGMGWTEHTAQRVATYLGREQTWENI